MIDLKEKTAKALYALLKELYKSPAAKEFVDEYEHERRHQSQEREKPKAGEVYRDIFDNRYIVFDVIETFANGDSLVTPFVALARVDDKGVPLGGALRSPTLEDFMNPTFKKV